MLTACSTRRKQLGLTQETLAELADVSPQLISNAENGEKLEVYRNGQMIGTQNSKSVEEAARDSQNNEANMMSSKEKTEKVLERLCRQYPTVSFASMKRHTPVRFKGMIVASIYYRSSEIRVEVQKGDFSMYVYNELAEQNIAYQKPSASPDSTPGKYSFFAPVDKAEDVLRTIIKKAVGGKTENYGKPIIDEEEYVDASLPNETKPSGTDSQEMIMRDLVRQVAKLQDVVMRQSTVQSTSDQGSQDQDRRYRIAATRHDTLDLKIIRADVPIRNLTFSLTIQAEGEDGISGQYQLFLLDESNVIASDIVNLHLSAGQHSDVHFTLASKMSRQGKCYLAVRDQRDAEDELLKLIPLNIQILFEADFDI